MSAKTVNKKDNQARAILRYLRMSPRKVRAASGGLRNKWVFEAEEILTHRTRRASAPLLKLLGSATANAVVSGLSIVTVVASLLTILLN